jgi:hypothetical protein
MGYKCIDGLRHFYFLGLGLLLILNLLRQLQTLHPHLLDFVFHSLLLFLNGFVIDHHQARV